MAQTKHQAYMQRALLLAKRGLGRVSPNPYVGCVVVRGNKIVGEGYHSTFGGPHAEVIALKKAGKKAHGATLYVNLEPCSHTGKTPPCAPLLAHYGIKRVFIAIKDPNPLVSGKGIRFLKKSKIHVNLGLEKEAGEDLNRAFIHWMKTKQPYVILKTAMTLDGKIATKSGESKWITGPEARRLVHTLRAHSDAVLVGASTANTDNPHLTSHGQGRNPLRVVVDPAFRTRPGLRLYTDKKAKTLIITSNQAPVARLKKLQSKGVLVRKNTAQNAKIKVKSILQYLSKLNVSQLLIEGGGDTNWNFLQTNEVQEILAFVSPKILGGRDSITPVQGDGFHHIKQATTLKNVQIERIGPDLLIRGRISYVHRNNQ